MSTHLFDLTLRVLLYKEDDEWAAHALEMDVIGYGKDEQAAVDELREMVFSQISFAAYKNDPELIPHPAPDEFFARWEEAQKAKILKLVCRNPHDKCIKAKARAIVLILDTEKAEMAIQRAHKGAAFELEAAHA